MKDELRKYFSELGKKGGTTTAKKYGKEHFSAMGKKSKRPKSSS